tara:strand:+ start:1087 stop:1269 length:183 start_codon:yes stop_codon:yes gene_type:complete
MVAFARAKAKSIFSKLSFKSIPKQPNSTYEKSKIEEVSIQKEKSSNYFLDAIKSGGIWLS